MGYLTKTSKSKITKLIMELIHWLLSKDVVEETEETDSDCHNIVSFPENSSTSAEPEHALSIKERLQLAIRNKTDVTLEKNAPETNKNQRCYTDRQKRNDLFPRRKY